MVKLNKVTVSISALAFLTIVFMGSLCAAGQKENLIITTYFPAPYGSYKELTTTGNTYLATGGGAVGIGIGIGATAPNTLLQVGTSPAPALFIQSSGNVAIGRTSLPAGYKLYVSTGNTYINGTLEHPAGTAPPGTGVTATVSILCKASGCSLGNRCLIEITNGIITNSTCS